MVDTWSSTLVVIQRCTFDLRSFARVPFRHRTTYSFPRAFGHSTRAMESSTNLPQVQYRGTEYNVIKEGLAHILNPPAQAAASKGTRKDLKAEDESQSVFYNPIQQFNRDLSVLAIRAYGEHLFDSKKQKLEQKSKKRAAGNVAAKGTKRKREDEAKDQPSRPYMAEYEGKAEVTSEQQMDPAFNEKQKVLPDLPTASSFTILDALSATGLRALRYAAELPLVSKVVANDLSTSAIQSMQTNVDYNELQGRIQPNLGDARAYMYGLEPSQRFDVIDLDPYGTASPFMDAAVQGVKDGGMLCVTCTDAGVWASTGYAEKAFSLYGGIPLKGSHSHEGGLRLILNGLAMSAAKYGLSIEPLLSLSIDFYARVFVRVYRSPAQVKFTAGNTLLVYSCDSGCGAWSTQPLATVRQKLDRKGNPVHHHGLAKGPSAGPYCEHCGFKTHLAGPMWGGPLHNLHFIQKVLDILPKLDSNTYQTIPRIEGMLTTALEEDLDLTLSTKASVENSETNPQNVQYPAIIPRSDPARTDQHPFYFTLSSLSKVLHCSTVPIDEFRGALHSIGYRSTRSHAKPNSIRTDAPWSVIWEVMREWVRQHAPIKEGSLKPGTAGAAIMGKSRDNLRKLNDQNEWLSLLKRDLLNAIESGRDVTDLMTKVEASLYRSGSRQSWKIAATDMSDTLPDANASTNEKSASVASDCLHPSSLDIRFDGALGREASAVHSSKRLVRYQINPRANWGPLNRATVNST
ncbi:tRNA (guanine(26)-N(2))-dimethyltransferase [Penicillium hispanicum]|uniref:tRNA (guanine(26)-N(2))-dimethyltransferase n=1 Tax=Penicillium hispanicum TaxID=1080232 RepID=UPI00254248C4|nr:tRNA (guanine(26)-N(2))-dimethyltransferase [Penicillium hispanicum]KAJ5594569.1 tRNA (guanine(26)-N(2))-dimethyltransferase [Penicillium hispanicum]